MKWIEGSPTQSGTYLWRQSVDSRVHTVHVKAKRGKVEMRCATMDLRQINAGGQWHERKAEKVNLLEMA